MAINHLRWERNGCTQINDTTGEHIFTSQRGQENIDDGSGGFAPYLWNDASGIIKYKGHELEFASDRQILKAGLKTLIPDSKFFVQKETSPNVWETVPHGAPVRNVIEKDGKLTAYLSFPDAPYDLQVGFEIGGSDKTVFGFRFRSPIEGNVRFVWRNDKLTKIANANGYEWVKSDYAPEKNKPERNIGIKFQDVQWRWTYEEAAQRTFSFSNNADGTKKLNIVFGSYAVNANEWLTVKPDTFGPSQIAADNNDGQEADDTTWSVGGYDADGSRVGDVSGVKYDMGMRFPNVTIANGATISSATVEVFMKYISISTADLVTLFKGFKETDTAVFGASARPSQRTQTTASVTRTYDGPTEFVDETYLSLDDCAAVVQEITDQGGWASGNAMGFVLMDNGTATTETWQLQDYANESGNAAKLTIVYTVGGGATITGQPTEVLRGGTGYTVTGSGFGASQDSGTLDFDGIDISDDITGWNDTTITFDINSALALQHDDVTGYVFTVTADDASTDDSAAVDFIPIVTRQFINLVSPITTSYSFLNGYSGDAPVTGDQLVVSINATNASPESIAITLNADGTWVLASTPVADVSADVYVIKADGTIGSTMVYWFYPDGSGGYVTGIAKDIVFDIAKDIGQDLTVV